MDKKEEIKIGRIYKRNRAQQSIYPEYVLITGDHSVGDRMGNKRYSYHIIDKDKESITYISHVDLYFHYELVEQYE